MFLYCNGKDGYNNLVDTLNTISQYYINNKYAESARSLGTNPANPEDEYTFYIKDYITQEMGYKASSKLEYTTDVSKMTTQMRKSPNKCIWLPYRMVIKQERK